MTVTQEYLEDQGYFLLREIDGRGWCGLCRFAFTVGLCYGLAEHSYEGRYCFESLADAIYALMLWTGEGDPDGDWIKHKGDIEYSNPNYQK